MSFPSDADHVGVLYRKKLDHGVFEDPYKTKVDCWLKGTTLHIRPCRIPGKEVSTKIETFSLIDWKIVIDDRVKMTLINVHSQIDHVKLKADTPAAADEWIKSCQLGIAAYKLNNPPRSSSAHRKPAASPSPPPAAAASVAAAAAPAPELVKSPQKLMSVNDVPTPASPVSPSNKSKPPSGRKPVSTSPLPKPVVAEESTVSRIHSIIRVVRGGKETSTGGGDGGKELPAGLDEALGMLAREIVILREERHVAKEKVEMAGEDSVRRDAQHDHLAERVAELEVMAVGLRGERDELAVKLQAAEQEASKYRDALGVCKSGVERLESELAKEKEACKEATKEKEALRVEVEKQKAARRSVEDVAVRMMLPVPEESESELRGGEPANGELTFEGSDADSGDEGYLTPDIEKEIDFAAVSAKASQALQLQDDLEHGDVTLVKAQVSSLQAEVASLQGLLETEQRRRDKVQFELEAAQFRLDELSAGNLGSKRGDEGRFEVEEEDVKLRQRAAAAEEALGAAEEGMAELSRLLNDSRAESDSLAMAHWNKDFEEAVEERDRAKRAQDAAEGELAGMVSLVEALKVKIAGSEGKDEVIRKEREARERLERLYHALELSLASKVDLEKFKAKEAVGAANDARVEAQVAAEEMGRRVKILEDELEREREKLGEAEEVRGALQLQVMALRERNEEVEEEAVEERRKMEASIQEQVWRAKSAEASEKELRHEVMVLTTSWEREREVLEGRVGEWERRDSTGAASDEVSKLKTMLKAELGRREVAEEKVEKQKERAEDLEREAKHLRGLVGGSEEREKRGRSDASPTVELARSMAREVLLSKAISHRLVGGQSADASSKGEVVTPGKKARMLMGSSERNRLATAEYLASLMKNATEISRVGKGMQAGDMMEIADHVEGHPSVERLFLSGNRLGSEGGQVVADMLRRGANNLARVDLRHNVLGDEGCIPVLDALPHNPTLSRIDLSANSITSASSQAVAQAMSKSAVLERLDVRNNQLGDEGAEAIALVLAKKCPVKSLDLASNGLTEKGAKALAAALESNKKLLMLDVRGNNIGEGGVSALQAACRASGVVGRQVLVPSFD